MTAYLSLFSGRCSSKLVGLTDAICILAVAMVAASAGPCIGLSPPRRPLDCSRSSVG